MCPMPEAVLARGVTVADSTVYYTLNVLPDDSTVITNPDTNV